MFNSLSARWQTLKTKYKKIIPFILTFIFCFNPLSVSAADNYYYLDFPNLQAIARLNGSNVTFDTSPLSNNLYEFTLGSASSINALLFYTLDNKPFNIDFNGDLFDYYFIGTVYGSAENISNFTFFPNDFHISATDHNNRSYTLPCTDINFYHTDTVSYKGFSVSAKVDFSSNTAIRSIDFGNIISGSLPSTLYFTGCVLSVLKDSSSGDSLQAVVNAINNQTDFIVNGDSSTGGIVSGADSSKSELESIVSEYQEIENSMLDNFTLYQDEILVDLRGWSWGGLRSCAKWVGDTLTDYYNNLGDFKQYIIYPLLLGIALFFIGRGSSIIGHLYRKPTVTTTYTESTSTRYRSGNHSGTNTSTTTYREGGVLRK